MASVIYGHASDWTTEELVDLLRNCPDSAFPGSFIAIAHQYILAGISDPIGGNYDAHDLMDNISPCLLLPGDENAYYGFRNGTSV